jgi:hypothetical protein
MDGAALMSAPAGRPEMDRTEINYGLAERAESGRARKRDQSCSPAVGRYANGPGETATAAAGQADGGHGHRCLLDARARPVRECDELVCACGGKVLPLSAMRIAVERSPAGGYDLHHCPNRLETTVGEPEASAAAATATAKKGNAEPWAGR